ncbi:c6 and c2h2 transcription factor [Diplodia corticola]|uniref:C6 and c2h2 transcription factor n=1 Tax=Diplodia corticola TaxID=236234 RepID=A0A1J9RBT4_9PEZI|nr:c6 and c2h2 transcription factor [Diplodia corticola]OJD37921.1 c6 and c2h2 transcription factor [Diplodia corticola]
MGHEPRAKRRKVAADDPHAVFRCQHPGCASAYRRKEHLNRHAQQHTKEPRYACNYCSRKFFRRDILRRHLELHDEDIELTRSRTSKACDVCRSRKTRCDGNTPCRTCSEKGLACTYNGLGGNNNIHHLPHNHAAPAAPPPPPPPPLPQLQTQDDDLCSDDNGSATPTPTHPYFFIENAYAENDVDNDQLPTPRALLPQQQPPPPLFDVDSVDPTMQTHDLSSYAASIPQPNHFGFALDASMLIPDNFSLDDDGGLSAGLGGLDCSESGGHAWANFPNLACIRRHIDVFWRVFHPKWLFLHKGSFRAEREPPFLLLSMVTASLWMGCSGGSGAVDDGGSQATASRIVALDLHRRLMVMLYQQRDKWLIPPNAADRATTPWPLATLQAMLIHLILAAFYGLPLASPGPADHVQHPTHNARVLLADLVATCRRLGVFDYPTMMRVFGGGEKQKEVMGIVTWVRVEEVKRLAVGLWRVSEWVGGGLGGGSGDGGGGLEGGAGLLSWRELRFEAPEPDELWTAEGVREFLARVSPTGSVQSGPWSSSIESSDDRREFRLGLGLEYEKAIELESVPTPSSQAQLLFSENENNDKSDPPNTASSENAPIQLTRAQRLMDWWFWESLSVTLSTACVISMAIVLGLINGKRLSEWTLPIRPNALISIFAAIARSALLLPLTECISQAKWLHFSKHHRRLQDLQTFDDASRGPLGSILFLGRMYRKAWLASLACLIIIAGMAVDPFAQQIIDYPLRPVPSEHGSDATTRVTQIYDTGHDNQSGNLFGMYADSDMQAAVLGGSLDRPLGPPFHCQTGNCTWPDLITLGVCNRCADITGQINETCTSNRMKGEERGSVINETFCSLKAPSGMSLQQTYTIYEKHRPKNRSNRWEQFVSTTDLPIIANKQINLYETNVDLGLVTVHGNISHHFFMKDLGHLDHDSIFRPSRQYTECTFYWCSRSYSDFRISNGTVQQGLITSAPLTAGETNITGFSTGEKTMINLTAPSTFPGNTSFSTNLAGMASTAHMMGLVFTTELTNQIAAQTGSDSYLKLDYTIFKADNLSRTMDGLAESMSNTIRQCGNATVVHGLAFRDETYMHVRWVWFILPASLVFFTAVILIVAARVNSRSDVVLWKSSMLPLLFHGLDQAVEAPSRQSKLSQVDARARVARARLDVTERDNLRFLLS